MSKHLSLCWDTSTSSQVSNCNGVAHEIYLHHKLQWPQDGLNWESLAYEIRPNGLSNYLVCKRFAVQTFLWSLEFVIQINLEHDTIISISLWHTGGVIDRYCNYIMWYIFETTFFELLLQPYWPVNHFHQCLIVRAGNSELIYKRWL